MHHAPYLRRQRGLTLMELMIVTAIIAILATVAYPAYQEYVTDSRRSLAMQALQELHAGMQQCALNPPVSGGVTADSYDECVDGSGWPLDGTGSSTHPVLQFYDLTVTAADATAQFSDSDALYILHASPKGPQAGDGELRLYSDGRRGWNSGGSFVAWPE